jgi:hypothetical protein
VSASESTSSPTSELERLRLENETLSGIVGVVTSGPDLAHILDRVVDLLTRATSSHACFVYLRVADRLVLRAASPVYSHVVGKVSFGVEEGLAGWTMHHREPAFIRDGAIDDPRTIYVPELEEERFQSMVAVPIPSRAEESIGAIVLHTVAPREFDEGILNVLSRAASLLAGAIENASLYEEARERVEALTQLSALGREIAAVSDRESLYRIATAGIRDLLGADVCRLYESEGTGGPLRRVAADPAAGADQDDSEGGVVLELLESGGSIDEPMRSSLATVLELSEAPAAASAVSLAAGGERIGVLVAASRDPWSEAGAELLRACAQQVALTIEKIDLIGRLTEENLARDLFDALAAGQLDVAADKAIAAGLDLERPHVVFEARTRGESEGEPWLERAKGVERAIKISLPGTFCDLTPTALRALTPVGSEGVEPAREVMPGLSAAAAQRDLAVGVSEAHRGLPGIGHGLREAGDATTIATLLGDQGNVVLYRDTGAYRYLIDLLDSGGPHDHLRVAVDRIVSYDRERGSRLLLTLDEYLSQGRSVAAAARALFIHTNTLRQRLERIETLTELSLEGEDLLALQLAVKLARVRSP